MEISQLYEDEIDARIELEGIQNILSGYHNHYKLKDDFININIAAILSYTYDFVRNREWDRHAIISRLDWMAVPIVNSLAWACF